MQTNEITNYPERKNARNDSTNAQAKEVFIYINHLFLLFSRRAKVLNEVRRSMTKTFVRKKMEEEKREQKKGEERRKKTPNDDGGGEDEEGEEEAEKDTENNDAVDGKEEEEIEEEEDNLLPESFGQRPAKDKQPRQEEEEIEEEEDNLLPESFGQRPAKDKQPRQVVEKIFVDLDELAKNNDFKPENCENKNLIVIDLNGLLMQRSFSPLGTSTSGFRIDQDAKVGNFYVYNRPHMKDFLDFLHENFTVGVWSSATEYNARMLVRHLWGKKKEKQLAFVWGQEKCTNVGVFTEPRVKPVFLKELDKLWSHNPEMEKFRGTHTVLIDDSPYKAVNNPMHSALHPAEFKIVFKEGDPLVSAPSAPLLPESIELKQMKGIKRASGIAPSLGKKRLKKFIKETRTSSTFDQLSGNDFSRFQVEEDDALAPEGELRSYLAELVANEKGAAAFIEQKQYAGKQAPLGPIDIVKDMVAKAKEIEANIANGIVLTSQMVKTKDAAEICLDDL